MTAGSRRPCSKTPDSRLVHFAVSTGRGHPNVVLHHVNTLEFTREERLTPRGDCIACVGVDTDKLAECGSAGFSRLTIIVLPLVGRPRKITICGISVKPKSKQRLVVRKTYAETSNTLIKTATMAARDLGPSVKEALKKSYTKCLITCTTIAD